MEKPARIEHWKKYGPEKPPVFKLGTRNGKWNYIKLAQITMGLSKKGRPQFQRILPIFRHQNHMNMVIWYPNDIFIHGCF